MNDEDIEMNDDPHPDPDAEPYINENEMMGIYDI